MNRLPSKLLAGAVAALVLTLPSSATAEFGDNFLGRDWAAATLGIAGSIAIGFDIGCIIYLAAGRDERPGRIIVGLGSMVGAGGLVTGAALSLDQIGEENIPGGSGGSEEEALHVGRALAGIDIGLAVVSFGLGFATIATYGSADDAAEEASPRLWLQPYALTADGDAGGGLQVVGEF